MDPTTQQVEAILAMLREAGKYLTLVSGLLFIILGAVKGWWIPGYLYRQKCSDFERDYDAIRKERDRQISMAEDAIDMADRLLIVANSEAIGWKKKDRA